jgi:hypothetical protein
LEDLRKARCGRVEESRANLIYPITGSTGMAEVVRTYVELEAFSDLTNNPAPGKKEIVVFSDKLGFTTTFDASESVQLEFKTAVGSLRLTTASLSGSAYRQDMHTVTVALARDKDADPDLVKSERDLVRTGRRLMVPMVGARPVPFEEIRDKDVRDGLARRGAVARNRVLLELERRRLVDEDRAVVARVLGQPLP